MGNRLIWDQRYEIGVDIIDREHKKLFGILNKLFDFEQREEKSQFACHEAIKYFKDHAIQHFTDEEAYMASIDYPGLATHRRIHKDFRARMLPALESELEATHFSATSIQHFLSVCVGWLIGHTLIEDHMIVSNEPVRHWEKLLPEEEQAIMEQTMASLVHSMFRLDAQLVSNCYTGEKFGDELCCRLVYSDRNEKKWEFYLLFEKQLIGSTIGNIIAEKAEAMDMMLSNVAGYVAKRLVERVKQDFTSLEQFELTSEHSLSYEQFHKMFEKMSPHFSLLFDTGRGYFAYCMAASETPLRKDGISAVTAKAMAEIENRLQPGNSPAGNECLRNHGTSMNSPQPGNTVKNTMIPKKKILVVDDSVFMRKSMLQLLGSDYEVLTADSGISAIRSIALARPDLMLLDYEMPVCNGSQMLEMIRSDKDFIDLPVIFLTCRVDRESVKKAISLRPEGYLSKSLSSEAIKKEIDHFFEKRRDAKCFLSVNKD